MLGRNGMGKKATEGLAALIVAEIRRLMGDVRISGIFTLIVGGDQRKALAPVRPGWMPQKRRVVLSGAADEGPAAQHLRDFWGFDEARFAAHRARPQSPGMRGGCSLTLLALRLRILMLIISTASENAMPK